MKRITLLGLVVGLLWLASPALAAAPFGSFGGIAGGGNGGGGNLPIHGWCLDDDGVAAVDIFIDGRIVGRADYGRRRTGVENRFPSFPDSAAAGFGFNLDTTRYHNGTYTVQPRCRSLTGEITFLPARQLQFTNTVLNLAPFGSIGFPPRNANLFGDCNNFTTLSVIDGWALDAGVEIGDEGIGYLELLVDGSILANTRRDCFFDEASGFLYNCAGLVRQDVERAYPGYKDSPRAGYRFALNIGSLIDFGFVRGFHVLTIRAGDISGQVANIAEIPVFFSCRADEPDEAAFGQIFMPRNGQILNDTIVFNGWALDAAGVERVEIWVDGEKIGDAFYGAIRGGVSARYPFPNYPDSPAPGWSFTLDTTQFVDGDHNLQVFVVDVNDPPGFKVLIGERDFRVDNTGF